MSDMSSEKNEYKTLSWEPEITAACLRVMVLESETSGIDSLKPWVRFRIQEAAAVLDRCAKHLEALERYVELVQTADREAFRELCLSTKSSTCED